MSRNLFDNKSCGFRTIRYYHTDQTGLPQEIADANGRVQWSALYSAWGEMDGTAYCNDKHKARWRSGTEYVHQPLRFQGQYFDRETGLHYNQHRYYDPDAGRLLTPDPLLLRGGINLYRYASNPGRWIDPSGLQGVDLNLLPGHAFGHAADYGNDVFSILSHAAAGCVVLSDGNTILGTLQPEELAEMVRGSPNYSPRKNILLIACNVGSGNKPYAQQLADELGSNVLAPNGGVGVEIGHTGPVALLHEGSNWQIFVPCRK